MKCNCGHESDSFFYVRDDFCSCDTCAKVSRYKSGVAKSWEWEGMKFKHFLFFWIRVK